MVYNNNNNNNINNNVGVFSNINYNSSTFLKRLSFYVMFVMLLNYFTYKGQCHDWIINITFCIFITLLNKIYCLVMSCSKIIAYLECFTMNLFCFFL